MLARSGNNTIHEGENMIEVENVFFSYNSKPVLEEVNFTVKKGEFVAVLGPNGAGKTTLLKLILGLLKPDKGRIKVFGYDTRKEKDKILEIAGYLPQRELLHTDIPLKVYQVISMPLKAKGKRVDKNSILKTLSIVGLEEIYSANFNELSGGLQQRVLIARALIQKPKILLLDEPFNGVDLPSQEKIIEILNLLSKENNVTIIAVVHNINPLLHHVDKVILLNRKLIAIGTPNEVFTELNIKRTYGTSIPLVVCNEGFRHPLYGDFHG